MLLLLAGMYTVPACTAIVNMNWLFSTNHVSCLAVSQRNNPILSSMVSREAFHDLLAVFQLK